MPLIVVTLLTFQEPIGWLNATAPLNILAISVTCPTFHADMSVLNESIF
jgi:hypothetical protein